MSNSQQWTGNKDEAYALAEELEGELEGDEPFVTQIGDAQDYVVQVDARNARWTWGKDRKFHKMK